MRRDPHPRGETAKMAGGAQKLPKWQALANVVPNAM